MRRAAGVGALLWVLIAVGAPTPADAHALRVEADPRDGASLDTPPRAVTLTFTEEPDPALSSIDVIDASGTSYTSGRAEPLDDPLRLRVVAGELSDGVYTVSWRVFSKVDGHVTAGAFAFGVNVDPDEITAAELPEEESPPPAPLEVAGRFGFYVGLAVLVGTTWIAAFAFPGPVAGHRRFLLLGWVLASAGWLALAIQQRMSSGAPVSAFLGSAIGRAALGRGVALVAVGVALVIALRGSVRRRRWVLGAALSAAFVAIRIHASAGHAAAGSRPLIWISLQGAHFAAAAVWTGGLAALLVGIRGAPDEVKTKAVRRFSTVAGITILAVAFTGTARAVQELGRFVALFSTSYGRVVVAKVALLGVLGVLGALNRYRSVPAAHTSLRALRRIGRIELAVAAVVLALAGLLATLVPSRSVVATTPDVIVADASDFARTVDVRLEIEPGFPGANDFRVTLTDPSSDESVDAERVALRFEVRGAVVEGSTLELGQEVRGEWSGRGANLAVGGHWRAVVLVGRGARSVEVEVAFATRCRSDAIRAPGTPTLHDVDIGSDRTAQAYADPSSAGFNEIHFTFFDAQGQELAVQADVEMTALPIGEDAPSDRGPIELDVRRFGPGHYIGGGELDAGPYRFDVEASRDEERLAACFEEVIG